LADGAQSWVRGQCDIGLDYRSYGQQGVALILNARFRTTGLRISGLSKSRALLLCCLCRGTGCRWLVCTRCVGELLREPLSAVSRLEEYCLDTLGHLTPVLPEDIKAFPLRLIRPHSMIAQRVALIGDAAHAVHPLAGHGMNLGFGDVTSLLALMKAREDHCDCGDAKLLERYRRSRKEDVMLMQITTDGLARLFGSDLAPLRLARNVGLNLLNRLPVLKNKLISHAMGK
jgi:2-polyprenyl-6-methoxyphenol hydroxylase-like FAD-dependent oxidoreductase